MPTFHNCSIDLLILFLAYLITRVWAMGMQCIYDAVCVCVCGLCLARPLVAVLNPCTVVITDRSQSIKNVCYGELIGYRSRVFLILYRSCKTEEEIQVEQVEDVDNVRFEVDLTKEFYEGEVSEAANDRYI